MLIFSSYILTEPCSFSFHTNKNKTHWSKAFKSHSKIANLPFKKTTKVLLQLRKLDRLSTHIKTTFPYTTTSHNWINIQRLIEKFDRFSREFVIFFISFVRCHGDRALRIFWANWRQQFEVRTSNRSQQKGCIFFIIRFKDDVRIETRSVGSIYVAKVMPNPLQYGIIN